MKAKKLLSVILAVIMLVGTFSVASFAADGDPIIPTVYETTVSYDLDLSEVKTLTTKLTYDNSSLNALNGTTDVSYVLGTPYILDSNNNKVFYSAEDSTAFFAAASTTGSTTVYVPVNISVNSDKLYGQLFVAVSLSIVNDQTYSVNLTPDFDTIYSAALVTAPAKSAYLEHETFDPRGLVVAVQTSSEFANNTAAQNIEYNALTAADFSFSCEANPLNVSDKAVDVFYKGAFVGTVEIAVSHNLTDWEEAKAASFFGPQTLVATCTVCGEKFYKYVPGTEGYLTAFAGNDTFLAIMSYVAVFFRVIDGFSKNIITEA